MLGGTVPESEEVQAAQRTLQPPRASMDVLSVIKGVIDAEGGAIRQYGKLISMSEGRDHVTQELCIDLLGEEEEPRRLFVGFRKEF